MKKKLNFKFKSDLVVFILLILFLLIISRFQLSIEFKTLLSIALLFLLSKLISEREFKTKINNYALLASVLVFTIFTQNEFLNFEIISLDTPSYLVASQNVGSLQLPYQTQWESKGPLFMYLYNLLSFFSGDSFIYFKILNDLIVFFIVLVLFLTLKKFSSDINSYPILGVLLLSCLFSYIWYHNEHSELYVLIFLSVHFYLLNKVQTPGVIFFSLLLASLATLINQSTIIFIVCYIFVLIYRYKIRFSLQNNLSILFGIFLPHLFFIGLYVKNELLKIYISNYITLPLNYIEDNEFNLYELLMWLKRYFLFNESLYYSLIFLTLLLVISSRRILTSDLSFNSLLYLLCSFAIYIIAGKNYQHHLFYTLYFFSILSVVLLNNKQIKIFFILIIVSFVQIFGTSYGNAYDNLANIDDIYQDYPMYNISKLIEKEFPNSDFSVLALDHVLILYYLNKENTSYIVHPSNNYEDYIVEELVKLNLLKTNESSHFSHYIDLEPDVIICSSINIIKGDPTYNQGFNCEITDYKKNYKKLEVDHIYENNLREYYFDPYRDINIYIKNN